MGKNIVIQEGGIGKQLTVDKLKTNLVGGGTCLWVPEDGTQLGTKYISENGTYSASSDGLYGYSAVTVNGVGSVTGTDGDGDEATVTKGDDDELVTEKIPSSIRVTTLPSKVNYSDGDAIEYGGMVVKAYLKTGGLYGTVPNGDLVLPVSTAVYNPDSSGSASSEYSGNISQPISFNSGSIIVKRNYEDYEYFQIEFTLTSGSMRSIGYNTGGELILYFVSNAPFSGNEYLHDKMLPTPSQPQPPDDYRWIANFSGGLRTIHGKPVYVGSKKLPQMYNISDPGAPTYSRQPNDNDFYTLVYGNIVAGSTMFVPVQWSRPGDSKTLETDFNINVSQ